MKKVVPSLTKKGIVSYSFVLRFHRTLIQSKGGFSRHEMVQNLRSVRTCHLTSDVLLLESL